MYFGAARCCRRVDVDMTEVDVVALQLITAARLTTSATAVRPVVVVLVVMLLLLWMLLGVESPALFRRYKTKRCWLDY